MYWAVARERTVTALILRRFRRSLRSRLVVGLQSLGKAVATFCCAVMVFCSAILRVLSRFGGVP